MKKITNIAILSLIIFASSCNKEPENPTNTQLDDQLESALESASDGEGLGFFKLPSSTDFNAIPQDPLNPLTTDKVELGEMLYHETGLATNPKHSFSKGTFSCATCHFASAGFQSGRWQAISDGGIGFGVNGEGRQRGALYQGAELDVQPLRTPTVLNSAYQKNMLWNGQFGATGENIGTEAAWTEGTPIATNHLGYEGVEIQAIAGLGVHRMEIEDQPEIMIWYQSFFEPVFADFPEESRYTKETAGLAIAAYERTVLSNKAPFQDWLNGDKTALSDAEKRGAIVFFDKANCASCHTGPALNSMEFHALGMSNLYDCPEEVFQTNTTQPAHRGRGGFTGNPEDDHKFKVPQLYNLADSPFYGHGSSFRSIRAVVEYKNRGVKENSNVPDSQLAEDFKPLNLTEEEIDDLTAFLTFGLRDPDLMRYQPSHIVSGNCFPNNDPMSKLHLGCD